MEYVKKRKPLSYSASLDSMTLERKGQLVSRRQSTATKAILSKLEMRQVGRDGRGIRESNQDEEERFPPIRRGGALLTPITRLNRTHSVKKLSDDTEGVDIVSANQFDDTVVERARKRFEEKLALKEKMRADMLALEEEEQQREKERQEKKKRIFERERAERAKHLEEWKHEMERKEQLKKRKEEKRKEKQRRQREEGLKQRQEKYLEELRERERKSRQKRVMEMEEEMGQRDEGDGRRGQSAGKKRNGKGKQQHSIKNRLSMVKNSYDPTGKLAPYGGNKKKKKPAKRMSDTEIVEMARQLVEGSRTSGDQLKQDTIGVDLVAAEPTASSWFDHSGPESLSSRTKEDYLMTHPSVSDEIESWYREQLESVNLKE